MNARVLGDLVARDRRSDDDALCVVPEGRTYTYRKLCTTAYKAGNFLRYLGVDRGDRIEIAPDPLPEPVTTFFGAALLGAATRFRAVGDGDARAVIVSRDREPEFDLPPGSKLAVYGGAPDRPEVAHWENAVWSENPAFPPTEVAPDDDALVGAGGTYTHGELLGAGRRVAEAFGVRERMTVAVRGPLSEPGVVAAGLVAPLFGGGTIVFPGDDTVCDVGVGEDVPDGLAVDPDDVL
jgi:hypothetical protein